MKISFSVVLNFILLGIIAFIVYRYIQIINTFKQVTVFLSTAIGFVQDFIVASVFDLPYKKEVKEKVFDQLLKLSDRFRGKYIEWFEVFSSFIEGNMNTDNIYYTHMMNISDQLNSEGNVDFAKITSYLVKLKIALENRDYELVSKLKEDIYTLSEASKINS